MVIDFTKRILLLLVFWLFGGCCFNTRPENVVISPEMEITGDYERVWEVCALPGSVRREFDEICFYHIESSGMGDYNDDSVFPGVLNSGDSSHGFLYGGHTGSYWFVVYRETGKSKNKTLFFKVHKNDEVSVWQYGAKPDGQTFDELIENLKAGDKKFTKILRMAEMEYEW